MHDLGQLCQGCTELLCGLWMCLLVSCLLSPAMWHSAQEFGEFAQPVVKMLSNGLFDCPGDYSTFNNLFSSLKELSLEPFKESEIQLSLAVFHLNVVGRKTFWVQDTTTETSLPAPGQGQVDVLRPKISMWNTLEYLLKLILSSFLSFITACFVRWSLPVNSSTGWLMCLIKFLDYILDYTQSV